MIQTPKTEEANSLQYVRIHSSLTLNKLIINK
jgi:hypothetical protein